MWLPHQLVRVEPEEIANSGSWPICSGWCFLKIHWVQQNQQEQDCDVTVKPTLKMACMALREHSFH